MKKAKRYTRRYHNFINLRFALLTLLVILSAGLFFAHSIVYSYMNATAIGRLLDRRPHFEITYTSAGFEPSLLTVPIGSIVEFRNTRNIPMFPASDPHPSHTDYPEFQADRDYASGEVFTFQFNRSGTFGYHNHERSIDRGIIRVFDPLNPIQDISKTIANQRTTRNMFLSMLDPHNTDSIFTVVDAIQKDPALRLNCHEIAHDLGHRSYELFGFSGAMTLSNPANINHASVQDICAGGYVHGVLEELSLHQPDFKDHPGTTCRSVPDANRASCFHGVGHALMFINKRNVSGSLGECRSIGRADDISRCFEGVWMEMFWGSTEHTGADSLGWDAQKPLAPCIETRIDAKPACFIYSVFGYLRWHAKDYTGSIRLCTHSGLSETDTGNCLKGVGITMMSHYKGQNLERSEIFTEDMGTSSKEDFYRGVIGYARLSGISYDTLTTTCGLFKKDKTICQNALEEYK